MSSKVKRILKRFHISFDIVIGKYSFYERIITSSIEIHSGFCLCFCCFWQLPSNQLQLKWQMKKSLNNFLWRNNCSNNESWSLKEFWLASFIPKFCQWLSGPFYLLLVFSNVMIKPRQIFSENQNTFYDNLKA
jgi:hypothetical protein